MTPEAITAAAAAIANARGMRRGVPEISNVLDILPAKLREEVMEDAKAALEAAAALGAAARKRGRQYLALARERAGHIVAEDPRGIPEGDEACSVADLIDSALIALAPGEGDGKDVWAPETGA